MPRNEFGRVPAGRSTRSNLTRRGLLGAAAVITGAGIADFVHKSGPGAASTPLVETGATSHLPVTTSSKPHITPSGSSHSHPPETTHTAPPTHPHSSHSADPHGGPHGRGHAQAHIRPVENVDLPPAKLRVRSRPIYYVDQLIDDAPKHAIALTVDDGPDPEYTPKVLRLLDKYRMQASFCIVGAHADAYPGLIRDIARAGHVIVNHTFTHIQPFNHQTQKRIVSEITRTQRAIEKAAKVTPQLFRAPGGAWSPFIFRAVASYDLIPLDWDVDPMDWAMPGTRSIQRAMLRGRPNDIVLCHDGGGNRSETIRALRKVLPDWKHRGYVTIPLVVPAKQLLAPTHSPATPKQTQAPTPSTTPSAQTSTTAGP
jgi:peptidoglycan/xylan/chitin deacetylase (PgdA/CDA1 family)